MRPSPFGGTRGRRATVALFEADLLAPGAFDPMFAGAAYVLHTASTGAPYIVD